MSQPDDPELMLDELLQRWPETVPVFIRHKMLCVGCLVTPFHSVVDACAEYGLDTDTFMAELQEAVSAGPAPR